MPPLNDDILAQIGLDWGDNSVYGSPSLVEALLPTLDAQEYRRRLVQVREFGIADGVGDTFVLIRLRPGPRTAWLVIGASWENQQAGAEADLIMRVERTVPAVPDFRRTVGVAMLPEATTEVVVGPMALVTAAVPSRNEQRPFEILVPALSELRFDLTKTGGGILEAGAQILEMTMLEIPRERSWERFRAQTVIVG